MSAKTGNLEPVLIFGYEVHSQVETEEIYEAFKNFSDSAVFTRVLNEIDEEINKGRKVLEAMRKVCGRGSSEMKITGVDTLDETENWRFDFAKAAGEHKEFFGARVVDKWLYDHPGKEVRMNMVQNFLPDKNPEYHHIICTK